MRILILTTYLTTIFLISLISVFWFGARFGMDHAPDLVENRSVVFDIAVSGLPLLGALALSCILQLRNEFVVWITFSLSMVAIIGHVNTLGFHAFPNDIGLVFAWGQLILEITICIIAIQKLINASRK